MSIMYRICLLALLCADASQSQSTDGTILILSPTLTCSNVNAANSALVDLSRVCTPRAPSVSGINTSNLPTASALPLNSEDHSSSNNAGLSAQNPMTTLEVLEPRPNQIPMSVPPESLVEITTTDAAQESATITVTVTDKAPCEDITTNSLATVDPMLDTITVNPAGANPRARSTEVDALKAPEEASHMTTLYKRQVSASTTWANTENCDTCLPVVIPINTSEWLQTSTSKASGKRRYSILGFQM